MKRLHLIKKILVGACAFLTMALVYAGTPLWTFTPLTSTTIAVSGTETKTVQYQLTNQSRKSHTLVMRTIPGITQVTTPGNCTHPFTLSYQQSCTLTLTVTGSALQGNVVGGPIVCQEGPPVQCYQPSLANSLNITVARLSGIAVTPANASIATGGTQQYTATGTYSNGSSQDITTLVTWGSSDGSVATISNAPGTKGLTSAIAAGSTTISAALGGKSGNTGLTVTSGAATITVTGSPLILFPAYPTLAGASRVLTITNTSSVTATNIAAMLPASWGDVTQDASACLSVAPGASCQLVFTPSTTPHEASIAPVLGNNTNTINTSLAVNYPWITNGAVNAIVPDLTNNLIYIGGSFTYVGPNTGSGVPLDENSGQALPTFPRVNGSISSVISDGAGGWYIGGNFTSVGGIARNRIAHILSDYTVDENFNPNANTTVNALALNGSTVYAGGNFATIGGQTRNCIAALDAVTGTATTWNPDASSTVNALALSGSTVYAGGGLHLYRRPNP